MVIFEGEAAPQLGFRVGRGVPERAEVADESGPSRLEFVERHGPAEFDQATAHLSDVLRDELLEVTQAPGHGPVCLGGGQARMPSAARLEVAQRGTAATCAEALHQVNQGLPKPRFFAARVNKKGPAVLGGGRGFLPAQAAAEVAEYFCSLCRRNRYERGRRGTMPADVDEAGLPPAEHPLLAQVSHCRLIRRLGSRQGERLKRRRTREHVDNLGQPVSERRIGSEIHQFSSYDRRCLLDAQVEVRQQVAQRDFA